MFPVNACLVKCVVHAAGDCRRLDFTHAVLFVRYASLVIIIPGGFVAAIVIFPTFKRAIWITGLGIASVAIGFSFKDVLQNFFAGILILRPKPFVVDQLAFRDYSGPVKEINIRSTRIKNFDGEHAIIPNGDIYANAILIKTAFDWRRVKFASSASVSWTTSKKGAKRFGRF